MATRLASSRFAALLLLLAGTPAARRGPSNRTTSREEGRDETVPHPDRRRREPERGGEEPGGRSQGAHSLREVGAGDIGLPRGHRRDAAEGAYARLQVEERPGRHLVTALGIAGRRFGEHAAPLVQLHVDWIELVLSTVVGGLFFGLIVEGLKRAAARFAPAG